MSCYHPILKEQYRGFDIYYSAIGQGWSNYFAIFKDGERATLLALHSVKACKNVIDTHLKHNGTRNDSGKK